MEKRDTMDLVRIESFCYTVRVQHLTPAGVQARALRDQILHEQIEHAAAHAKAMAELDGGDEASADPEADGDAKLYASDGQPQTFKSPKGRDSLPSSSTVVKPDQGGPPSKATDQDWDDPKDLPGPAMPTHVELNQQIPLYDMILLLPNDEHEGIRDLVRLEVLRRFPQIGVVLGESFEKDAIELTIHNVALIGKAFGDAHALAELEATTRG